MNPTKDRAKYYPAELFLLSALVLLIVLPLFQKGTFIDGQLYKTVAFNTATGQGGFWQMKYTNTCMPFFCEQPPLYSYLLGNFYKGFGTGHLTDRVFTLLLFLIFAVVIHRITKQLFGDHKLYFSLFVFFLLSVPVWCWSYVNQVIEPLVCLLVAVGISCFAGFLKTRRVVFVLLFALVLVLSFLSKGFQSCFLIVLPLCYFLWNKFPKPAFYFTVFSGLLFALTMFFVLGCNPAAEAWMDCYYKARLVLTMQNVGATTDSHTEIVVRFFTELIVPFLLLLVLCCWLKWKKKYPLKFVLQNFAAHPLAMPLLLTAFAGSLPYSLSLVQRGFYLVPSFVCFVLAALLGFRRYWLFFAKGVSSLFSYKYLRVAMILIFVGTIIYSACFFNAYKRDRELLTDIEYIAPYLKKNDTIHIENSLWNYFNLHSYLYMQKQVSLSIGESRHRYYICNKSDTTGLDPSLHHIQLPTQQLDLYIRKIK